MNDINRYQGVILPEIKTPNLNRPNNNDNLNNKISPHFPKSPNEVIINKDIKNDFPGRTNFYKNIKINTNSNYINDNTQTTTIATNSTKKCSSSKINNIQSLNEDSSQYSMGLISAGSTANNNIIIPILTMRRPASNFNNGGGIIHNFNEKGNNNLELNKKSDNLENNIELFNLSRARKERNKICKSQEIKGRFNASIKNKEINNLFPSMQKLVPNYHKIKIEKGMNNINLGNTLSKKITFEFNNNLYVK